MPKKVKQKVKYWAYRTFNGKLVPLPKRGEVRRYKKSIVAYTFDDPVRRINNELGITLYKTQNYEGSNEARFPRYGYKVTFELVSISKEPPVEFFADYIKRQYLACKRGGYYKKVRYKI